LDQLTRQTAHLIINISYFSTDISSLAALLPPKMGVVKYLPLRFTDVPRLVGGATHIVLSQPRDLPPKSEAKVSE
jgi:hypothetical protein